VDAADGDVEERYHYDPDGKVTVLEADFTADGDGVSDWDNCVLFAGYVYDYSTGLYCVRRRPYHPTVGRWLVHDYAYADGMNLYEYVKGSPVYLVDPLGLKVIEGSVLEYLDWVLETTENLQTAKAMKIRKRAEDFGDALEKLKNVTGPEGGNVEVRKTEAGKGQSVETLLGVLGEKIEEPVYDETWVWVEGPDGKRESQIVRGKKLPTQYKPRRKYCWFVLYFGHALGGDVFSSHGLGTKKYVTQAVPPEEGEIYSRPSIGVVSCLTAPTIADAEAQGYHAFDTGIGSTLLTGTIPRTAEERRMADKGLFAEGDMFTHGAELFRQAASRATFLLNNDRPPCCKGKTVEVDVVFGRHKWDDSFR
jgi:RHS repeat-associated protein